jgi:methylase of polypeptide subunit release factors
VNASLDKNADPHLPLVSWTHEGQSHSALWLSANGLPPPRRVIAVNDDVTADSAYRWICEGNALLWHGDFHNARQLLQALARRIDKPPKSKRKEAKAPPAGISSDAFHQHRMHEAQRARLLGLLLVPHNRDHGIELRRAPDARAACLEARGEVMSPYVASLRDLLGVIGAHEWRRTGVEIAQLDARIHPHYGVYSPVRGEYLDLIAQAALPAALDSDLPAFDIGTGTGVIAALLARKGVKRIIATDNDDRALACARENIERLGLGTMISVEKKDLFPDGLAGLVVCNPPWIPGKATTLLERAVYDPDSRMLRGFIAGLGAHLGTNAEGWLILSDIAEHLGLRSREELLSWFEAARLVVIERHDIKPRHRRATEKSDPLHAARSKEITSLWRLRSK